MVLREGYKSRFYFKVGSQPESLFQVVDFKGEEEMSRLFRFEINLVSEETDIDFGEIVNQPATLTLMRGNEPTYIRGLVTRFEQAGKTPQHVVYRVLLEPRLHRLRLFHQSRIFQQANVRDIIEQVLKEAKFSSSDYRFELSGSYSAQEYVVQYQETDFNFICRLMEDEGIYFYFDHSGDNDCLVMVDDRSKQKEISGESSLVYHDPEGLVQVEEFVHNIVCREQLVTGKVVLKDYNYRTPETTLLVESQLNSDMPGLLYEYGDHFKDNSEGRSLAKIRNEELECRRRLLTGKGVCEAFRSGYQFSMEEHYRSDLNEDYLIVRAEHVGSQRKAMGVAGVKEFGDEELPEYQCTFMLMPARVQFRPERITPIPRIPGIMTAKVETAGGDYAYIDDEGRYRAKMFFDLSDRSNGTATRPIRMNQPHSGKNYGIHFPNHANTEMVWACIDGNVDRPIALGTIPNPSNTSPSVSKNKFENIVRTKAGNQMIMDDTKDKCQIMINTPDVNKMLFDDKDDRIVITTTNKHQMRFDDKNQCIEAKTTDGHFLLMDDKNKKITLQSKDGHWLSINDKDKIMTISDESGNNYFSIDIGNNKLTIMTKQGDIDMHAPQGHIHIKSKTLKTETTGDTETEAANIKSEAKMNHEMKATNITAKAKMNYKQKGGMNLESEAGMKHAIKGTMVESQGSMKNDLKSGAMTNVQAGGICSVSGPLVKIN